MTEGNNMERKTVKNGVVKVKIVVACTNANGDADLFFFVMKIAEEHYNNGDHYDAAKDHAEANGYEAPMVVFDDSMPTALENIFVWESASVVDF
jgi:hypothetical protein